MKFRLPQLLMMLAGVVLSLIGAIAWVFVTIPQATVEVPAPLGLASDVPTPAYSPIEKLIRTADATSAGEGEMSADGAPADSGLLSKININAATSEELQTLPRVGEKTAQAILEYRATHGSFKSVDDLGEIRGLGKKTIAKFRDLAYCGPAAELSTPDPLASPVIGTAGAEEAAEQRSGSMPPSGSPAAAVPDINGANPVCDGSRININTASEEELQTLPRVGPAMAAKIVKHREENGRFTSIDDLKKVKGIGVKTFERLKPMVCAE